LHADDAAVVVVSSDADDAVVDSGELKICVSTDTKLHHLKSPYLLFSVQDDIDITEG